MPAMKNLAAITGLHPFNLNRLSFTVAFSVAVLVTSKLVNAYLFCGFNQNVFFDLPVGAAVFVGYCIMPLLGLAVNRTPAETKRGRCCQTFALCLILIWHVCACSLAIIVVNLLPLDIHSDQSFSHFDPFNVCGNRTIDNVRAQFGNATTTFDVFQRIDLICKFAVGLGWLILAAFLLAGLCLHLISIDELDHQARQSRSVEARMENLSNVVNEPGSDAEPQFEEAKEPESSIVGEEDEEATTTKATKEDSK